MMWTRWRWVLLDDNLGECHAWRQQSGNHADAAVASNCPERRTAARLFIHRSRQHSKRNKKLDDGVLEHLPPFSFAAHEPEMRGVPISPSGTHPWKLGPFLLETHCVFAWQNLLDTIRHGNGVIARIEKFCHQLESPWVFLWLDLCQTHLWLGIPAVPKCSRFAAGEGSKWHLGPVEAISNGSDMEQAQACCGARCHLNLCPSPPSIDCARVHREEQIFEFFGSIWPFDLHNLSFEVPANEKYRTACSDWYLH